VPPGNLKRTFQWEASLQEKRSGPENRGSKNGLTQNSEKKRVAIGMAKFSKKKKGGKNSRGGGAHQSAQPTSVGGGKPWGTSLERKKPSKHGQQKKKVGVAAGWAVGHSPGRIAQKKTGGLRSQAEKNRKSPRDPTTKTLKPPQKPVCL